MIEQETARNLPPSLSGLRRRLNGRRLAAGLCLLAAVALQGCGAGGAKTNTAGSNLSPSSSGGSAQNSNVGSDSLVNGSVSTGGSSGAKSSAALSVGPGQHSSTRSETMPVNREIFTYDSTNPVIYDNDSHSDVYTDEYICALASAGSINLRGIITTSPENECVNIETYELDAAGREAIIKMARASGMHNIPDAVRGPSKPVVKPASGKVEDTAPLYTDGAALIVSEAKKATPEKPLVLLMGGPLTVLADAYAMNHSITDRVVAVWIGGENADTLDYNALMDRWAVYVVASKFELVQFPVSLQSPQTPPSLLMKLPASVLRQYMLEKRLPHVNKMPYGVQADADSHPVVSLMNKDFILETRRMSLDGWANSSKGSVPVYKDDAQGDILVVMKTDRNQAEDIWWEGMSNAAAWNNSSKAPIEKIRPFYATAFPVGGIFRIEAEDFNNGAEGNAYHSLRTDSFEKIYRSANVNILNAADVTGGYNMGLDGGYCLNGLQKNEWFTYLLNVTKAGSYDVTVRVASKGKGGSFHLDFNGTPTDTVSIPDTGGVTKWTVVKTKAAYLPAGTVMMTLHIDSGTSAQFGSINYFQFGPA